MEQLVLFPIEIERFQNILNDTIQNSIKSYFNSQSIENASVDILNVKDVALLLGISESTVHNYKRQGLLPYHKIGRKTYFKKSEVIESIKKINNGE